MDDKFAPVITNGNLPPNYTEQEIIVIDLVPADPLVESQGEKHTSPGESDWWASCNRGVIDSRPRFMAATRGTFDRILSHGGVFIIFADSRESQKIILGHMEYGNLVKDKDISYDNWSFLSILESFNIEVI